MRLLLLAISLWAFLACALAWPFPTNPKSTPPTRPSICEGSSCPPSGPHSAVFAETGFISNAERLKRGLPLLKPTQRRVGGKVKPRVSAVPRAHSERADRTSAKRTLSVDDL